MYSKPLENSPVQFQWKVWGSTRITKFKRRIFYFIFIGRMSSWGLLCVLIPFLARVPHCIMYEGICILYLAGLAVVGRNSLYLLFIARALWPHGLSIELALTAQYSPPDTDLPCCCCWNQFFVFNWKQRENNGVVTMDPKGVELHTAPASDKENKTKSFQPAGSARGIWGRTWLRYLAKCCLGIVGLN